MNQHRQPRCPDIQTENDLYNSTADYSIDKCKTDDRYKILADEHRLPRLKHCLGKDLWLTTKVEID